MEILMTCVLEPCTDSPDSGRLVDPAAGDLNNLRGSTDIPCQVSDPDMWFSENPRDLEQAKTLCVDCPLRTQCLQAALDRAEPWGVWGGEILDRGVVIARKRPRGRPRKNVA